MGEESRGNLKIWGQSDKIEDRTSYQVNEYRKGKVCMYVYFHG